MSGSALFENDLPWVHASGLLIGVDEAGRGALAGPVVAGAVALDQTFYHSVWCQQRQGEINDSKKLSAFKRETLYTEFTRLKEANTLRYAAGIASVAEIEKYNILGATKLAMARALETLQKMLPEGCLAPNTPEEMPLFEQGVQTENFSGRARILVDGNPLKAFPYAHQAIVHGDARSLAIAAASIIAKVTRDRIMDGLDTRLPLYGFAEHKGYATRAHRAAILQYGPSTEHRPLFLRKLYAGELPEFHFDPAQKIS
jgi:ribonuclease HII